MTLAYVAGPYRSKAGPRGVHANMEVARNIALSLWDMGYAVICPHLNTQHMDGYQYTDADTFIRGDLEILSRCDVMFLAPNWEFSKGVQQELAFALEKDIPVLTWSEEAAKLFLNDTCKSQD